MMLKSAVAVTLFAATAVLAQSGPQINTPGALTECQPVLLTWSGGQGPYFVSVIPGGQPGAAALVDFGSQSGNQLTWKVNLPAGTNISLKIVDQTGNTNYAQAVNIQKGSDESCVGKPVDNAASAGGSSTPSAAAGGAAPSAGASGAAGASGSAAAPTSAGGAAPSGGAASPSAGGASPSAAKPSASAGGASAGAAGASGSASHAAGSSGAAAPSASASKPSSANKIIASTGLVALLGAFALLF